MCVCVIDLYIYMREHARARPGKPDFQSTNQKQLKKKKNCKNIYIHTQKWMVLGPVSEFINRANLLAMVNKYMCGWVMRLVMRKGELD